MARKRVKIGFSFLVVVLSFTSGICGAEPYFNFGPSFYGQSSLESFFILGNKYYVIPLERSTLDVRHTGDLLRGESGFFQSDLVTDGREVLVSGMAAGPGATAVMWRGRRWRNLHNHFAELQIMPPLFINSVISSAPGSINGIISTGMVVNFEPPEVIANQPVTFLHHRDGFYDFAPVEFIHSRPLKGGSVLTFGGYFPKSDGRFEHSRHTGRTFLGDYVWHPNAKGEFRLTALQSRNDVEIPFTTNRRTYVRDDVDLTFQRKTAIGGLKGGVFLAGELDKTAGYRSVGRTIGGRVALRSARLHSFFNYEANSVDVGETGEFHAGFVDFGITGHQQAGRWGVNWLMGATGWTARGIRPIGGWETTIGDSGGYRAKLMLMQSVHPLSPDMRTGEFRSGRPNRDWNSVWRLNTALPVKGRELPTPVSRFIGVSNELPLPVGRVESLIFGRWEVNPNFWTIEGDTMIIPATVRERRTIGFNTNWKWNTHPWRVKVSVTGFTRTDVDDGYYPLVQPEPGFRALCEIGWHRSFWNDIFEADVTLGGSYISRFRDRAFSGWVDVGGAYPLTARATIRIKRFTLYYGLNNWNSFQYDLIPGYRMMHHEEYWGVHWTLLN